MSKRKTSAHSRTLPKLKVTQTIQDLRQNEVAMKVKVRSLELEVETLRCRLESLRKAKNTTVVKIEREERRITAEQSASSISKAAAAAQSNSLQKVEEISYLNSQLLSLQVTHQRDIEGLREIQKQKLSEVEAIFEEKAKHEFEKYRGLLKEINGKCNGLESEITELKEDNACLLKELKKLNDTNRGLTEVNILLQGKFDCLMEDYSIKESKWNQREEQLMAEIRKEWGARYHEWIVKAERKMEELQKINSVLQSMLKMKN